MPILFTLFGHNLNLNSSSCRGTPPPMRGMTPLPVVKWVISGVTKDSAGVALASCAVALYRTVDDVLMERSTSDGTGAYAFGAVSLPWAYYVVAYRAGSPDVAGTTRNDLLAT